MRQRAGRRELQVDRFGTEQAHPAGHNFIGFGQQRAQSARAEHGQELVARRQRQHRPELQSRHRRRRTDGAFVVAGGQTEAIQRIQRHRRETQLAQGFEGDRDAR
jgi:hypothetical protein